MREVVVKVVMAGRMTSVSDFCHSTLWSWLHKSPPTFGARCCLFQPSFILPVAAWIILTVCFVSWGHFVALARPFSFAGRDVEGIAAPWYSETRRIMSRSARMPETCRREENNRFPQKYFSISLALLYVHFPADTPAFRHVLTAQTVSRVLYSCVMSRASSIRAPMIFWCVGPSFSVKWPVS